MVGGASCPVPAVRGGTVADVILFHHRPLHLLINRMYSKIFRDLVIGLGVALVLFALGELGARLFWRVMWPSDPMHSYSEDAGSKLKPGEYDLKTSRFGFAGKINSKGYRGEEWSPVKPKDTVRILVLGDSVVMGGSKADAGFPSRLGVLVNRKLAKTGKKAEVMNGGASANTSAQALWRLEHEFLPLSPDIAILSIGFSDMYIENPRMIPTKIPSHWTRSVARHSYLMRAVLGVVYKVILPKISPSSPVKYREELEGFKPAFFMRNLRDFVVFSRKHGIHPILLTIPCRINSRGFESSEFKPIAFPYEQDVTTYRMLLKIYNDAIRETAREENCDLVDMDQIFSLIPGGSDLFSDMRIHMTDQGYDTFGDELFGAIEKLKPLSLSR